MMKFEYVERNRKIDDKELIIDMKKVAEENNLSAMSMREYSQFGMFDCSTITRRFGTWNNALELAGIGIKNRAWSETELFENLENVWIKKGCQPSRRDMDDKQISHISSGAYLRKYGKWSTALKNFIEFIQADEVEVTDPYKLATSISHKTKRDVNLRLRFKVLQRDNFKCCACGASPAKDSNVELHVDHIIPWAKGGETEIGNLQCLCSKCNIGKSDTLL